MTPTDFVPDWAKGIVWYQNFPERFWNGDPGNDPRLEDQTGAWPHDQSPPWQIHPWTADWYELQPYERANGQSLWHNLQRRRYGGDLQGIIDRLDYLQELGVGALYLNPVFVAPSSHKYDSPPARGADGAGGAQPQRGDAGDSAAGRPGQPLPGPAQRRPGAAGAGRRADCRTVAPVGPHPAGGVEGDAMLKLLRNLLILL